MQLRTTAERHVSVQRQKAARAQPGGRKAYECAVDLQRSELNRNGDWTPKVEEGAVL